MHGRQCGCSKAWILETDSTIWCILQMLLFSCLSVSLILIKTLSFYRGTDFNHYNPIGDCAQGYQKILCADCQIAYQRVTDFICDKCPPHLANVFSLLALLLFFIILFLLIIKFFFQTNSFFFRSFFSFREVESQTYLAVHLRMIMNYLQMIILISFFNLDWPDVVNYYLI